MENSPKKTANPKTFLVFGGKSGWVGQWLVRILREQGHKALPAESRLEYKGQIEKELAEVKPDYVLNCAGKTGRPNIDWCESNTAETLRANVIGALVLFDACNTADIPCVLYGTGCIFSYDKEGPYSIEGGKGFKEEDHPNFLSSYYSATKAYMEEIFRLTDYPKALVLRLRLPIGSSLNPRSLITKLLGYKHLVNIPNSCTVLEDMLPLSIKMVLDGKSGIYNFTNPGVMSHNEAMSHYRDNVDPSFTWLNFSEEEQNKIIVAGRSQNKLDTSKLEKEYPEVLGIQEAMAAAMKLVKINVDNGGFQAPPKPE